MLPAGWLDALRERCDLAPERARDDLWARGCRAPIGSIEPAMADEMARAGLPLTRSGNGCLIDVPSGAGLDPALATLARWLAKHGRITHWRDELLPVRDADDNLVASIERAAVRALGIATEAVHLVGFAAQGGCWIQQRAFDKAVDPGLWDTLMGGTVSAGEAIDLTLARETWEEAGLQINQLEAVTPQGRFTVRRTVAEGYMIERVHVFHCSVPSRLTPVNQDGEVERFERVSHERLVAGLLAGEFTLEAARVLAEALQQTSV